MTSVTMFIIITLSCGVFATTRCSNYKMFQEGSNFRPVVKLQSNNLCYWAFDQGPCSPGEWIRFNEDLQSSNTTRLGFCQARPCPKYLNENVFHRFRFQFKEIRYQSGTVNWNFCRNNHTKIYFMEDDDLPICRESLSSADDPEGRGFWSPFLNFAPIKAMRRGHLFD